MNLEELIAERKRIDEQIKALKNNVVSCGHAKFGLQSYPTTREDEWYVSINRIIDYENTSNEAKSFSIIRSNDREICIGYIDVIISDLQGLRDKLIRGYME